MTYYLQMDGVDDYLKTPSITFTEVILDVSVEHKTNVAQMYIDPRSGVGFTAALRNTSNVDNHDGWDAVYIDSVSKTNNTVYVPTNQRCVMRLVNSVGTDDLNIFSHNSGTSQFVKGKIYNVKIYNGTTLQAHYDMTTQTVQDQSGNGRHATLVGGTWVDDGVGGDPGTDGSISLSLKQSTYNDNFSSLSTKQAIYADNLATLPLRQSIYEDVVSSINTVQQIYRNAYERMSVNQTIYNDSSITLNARQEIYTEGTSILSLIQQFYEDTRTFITLALRQEIYEDNAEHLALYQTIYNDASARLDLIQRAYTEGIASLPLMLDIRDDLAFYKQVIEYVLTITPELRADATITKRKDFDINV